jgi:DnaJ-class molecular chaperone
MNLDTCADCGGRLELTDVSAGESTAVESYECRDCGGTGTYVNEFGVPGGGVHGSGVVGE